MEDIERTWTTASVYFLTVLNQVNDVFHLGLEEEIREIDSDLKARKRSTF